MIDADSLALTTGVTVAGATSCVSEPDRILIWTRPSLEDRQRVRRDPQAGRSVVDDIHLYIHHVGVRHARIAADRMILEHRVVNRVRITRGHSRRLLLGLFQRLTPVEVKTFLKTPPNAVKLDSIRPLNSCSFEVWMTSTLPPGARVTVEHDRIRQRFALIDIDIHLALSDSRPRPH